ncbi:hypothetical protein ACFL43_03460 [Thermodesulfobacteriota bacterium]
MLLAALLVPGLLAFPGSLLARRFELLRLQRDMPGGIPLVYHLRTLQGRERENFLRINVLETEWIEEAMAFFERRGVAPQEWVFTTFNNTVMLFYTDLRAQLLWPVRKSFFETATEHYWIVIDPYDADRWACRWFYAFAGLQGRCSAPDYLAALKNARAYPLPSGAVIYECNPEN